MQKVRFSLQISLFIDFLVVVQVSSFILYGKPCLSLEKLYTFFRTNSLSLFLLLCPLSSFLQSYLFSFLQSSLSSFLQSYLSSFLQSSLSSFLQSSLSPFLSFYHTTFLLFYNPPFSHLFLSAILLFFFSTILPFPLSSFLHFISTFPPSLTFSSLFPLSSLSLLFLFPPLSFPLPSL